MSQTFQDELSCTLVIKQAYAEDEGVYMAVAVNSSGRAESKCTVAVESKWGVKASLSVPFFCTKN